MAESGLTLAVIVKDEADLLAGLLEHHAGLYQEAVVVDTGSQDRSREVARSAGARVFDFPWCDDFSAARNRGLQQARHSWVLHLDCDERLNPRDFRLLLESLTEPAEMGYALPVHNYTATPQGRDWRTTEPGDHPWHQGAPGYFLTHAVRLFPNHPQWRFQGVVHEVLEPVLENGVWPIETHSAVIHHTGLLDPRGLDRRNGLYERLLLKKVRQRPTDLQALTELARLLVHQGRYQAAERLLRKGLELAEKASVSFRTLLLMVEIQARLGKREAAQTLLEYTIEHHPAQLLCWVQAAGWFLFWGDQERGRAYLKQGLSLFPASTALQKLEAQV